MTGDQATDANIFKWIVGTIISLLAAGAGIVALIKHFKSSQIKIGTRFWLNNEGYYELAGGNDTPVIRPIADKIPAPNAQDSPQTLYPEINIDVTNLSGKRISVNALKFDFWQLRGVKISQPAPAVLMVKFKDDASDAGRESLARKHNLELADMVGPIHRYRLTIQRPVKEVVQEVAAEKDVVEYAAPEAAALPHREWVQTEPVDINLALGRTKYEHQVGHSLAANESLTIPVTMAAAEPLEGSANVSLVYNSNATTEIGYMNVKIVNPSFLKTVERKPTGKA